MDQDLPRRIGSTSSIKSHSTDRDSPGTPTPNPRRFKENNRPDISKAKAGQHTAPELPTDGFRFPQKVQSTLNVGEADSGDGELSTTPSDTEDSASSNCSEHPITKIYNEYDLKDFTPQDFDLLLTLAPADQLPVLTTSEVKADVASSLPDRHSAIRTAIKRYVIFHKFNQDPYASHTTSQRRAFERNVYDYARAYGLSKQEASSEIRKARIIGGAPEDDSEDSSFGSEVDDTSEILSHLAKTTFSLRDIQMVGKNGIKDDETQMPKRVKKARKRTRRGRKSGGEEHNTAATRNTGADADHDGKGAPGKANVKSAKSEAIEVPSSSRSVPAAESQSSRRKRKRMDVETAGDTTNQPPRRPKESKHFQRSNQEQPTTSKSQPISDSTAETMEMDVVNGKDADKPQTTPTLPKDTEKAAKRQEKRKRRCEKHATELKEGLHSGTQKPREDESPGFDVAQLSSAKLIATKPSTSENSPPPERKKRNRRKSKCRDSESRVDAGAPSSRPEDQASSKELGPNDPKSEQEAHQNFLRANIYDPQESTLTADKTPRELAEAEEKQSKFFERLEALKEFSNEKQLQLYADGKYATADKQTKDDLKDLKEEKTTMEEMDIDTPKIDKGRKNKEQKKARRSKTKRDKAAKDEESGGDYKRELGNTISSSTKSKRKKRGVENQESISPNEQDMSVSIAGPAPTNNVSTKDVNEIYNCTDVLPHSLSLSEVNAISDVGSTQEIDQMSTTSVPIGKKSSALPSPPKSPAACEATEETGEYQEIISIPASVSPLTPVKSHDADEHMDMRPVCTPSRKLCRRSASKTSPFFPKITTSCIPFPPLRAPSFGLIQEKLSHDPYRLLIAVIFLNKTKGQVAVPVFWKVIERYPTPQDLAAAEQAELVEMIGHLGLQNQRAATCINLAKKWIDQVPCKGVRYRRLHYPKKDDGKDIQCNGPPIGDDDARSAWEIAHLPGIGPYAIDSWRIFCRDKLRGLATGWNGEGAASRGFEPEWRRVLPLDKELRAFLRWMWLRHGWDWDPLTGTRTLASDDLILQATRGGTAHERGDGNWVLKPQEGEVEPSLNQVRGDGEEEIQAVQSRGECVQDTEICSGRYRNMRAVQTAELSM